jgi:hypothetical protein
VRRRGRALLLGDAPGVEVGVVRVVDPDPELDGDRNVGALGGAHGGGTIWPKRRRLYGSAAPPPRRVTLGTGQPKFMSMWSARFSSTIIFAAS